MVVALLTESVDRNWNNPDEIGNYSLSLSSRRAWIEIALVYRHTDKHESRSPHGERG